MLYKYCSVDGFDILLESRLKATQIEEFNDPFELIFGVNEDSAFQNVKRELEERPHLKSIWQSVLKENQVSCNGKSFDDLVKDIAHFQVRDFKKIFKELREHWNKTMGIICFSESSSITQMWSHYANNHQGIVIGIERKELSVVKVKCRNEMVRLPITALPENLENNYYEKYFLDVLERKELNWSYENEVRAYIKLDEKNENGNYYFNISPSSIKEIYLGLKSHETTRIVALSIRERSEYRHLKIFEMNRPGNTYKLEPCELKC